MLQEDAQIFDFDEQQNCIQDYIKNSFSCPICYQLMKKPLQLVCNQNHRICNECADQIKEDNNLIKCPFDRKSMQFDQLKECPELLNQIKILKVKCPNSLNQLQCQKFIIPELKKFIQPKCQWTGNYVDVDIHIADECVDTLSLCSDCDKIIQMGNDNHSKCCLEQEEILPFLLCNKNFSWKKKIFKRKEILQIHQDIYKYLTFKPKIEKERQCQYQHFSLSMTDQVIYIEDDKFYEILPGHYHIKSDGSCLFEQVLCPKCQFVRLKMNLNNHTEEECQQNITYYNQALSQIDNQNTLELEIHGQKFNQILIAEPWVLNKYIYVKYILINKHQDCEKKIKNDKIMTIRVQKNKEDLLQLINFWLLFRGTGIKYKNFSFQLYYKNVIFVDNMLLFRNFSHITEDILDKQTHKISSIEIINVNKKKRTAALKFQKKEHASKFLDQYKDQYKVFKYYIK